MKPKLAFLKLHANTSELVHHCNVTNIKLNFSHKILPVVGKQKLLKVVKFNLLLL